MSVHGKAFERAVDAVFRQEAGVRTGTPATWWSGGRARSRYR